MQVFLLSLLLLILLIVATSDVNTQILRQTDEEKAYGFAFTTIPPRFRYLRQTILSLLTQQHIEPKILMLSIPTVYSRFNCTDVDLCFPTPATGLMKLLGEEFPTEVAYERIQVTSVDYDYGPITKVMGLIRNFDRFPGIQNWIVCDDDVSYAPDTYLRYYYALKATKYKNVLTHFSEDYRVAVKLQGSGKIPKLVQHIQGVDTYLLPADILQLNPIMQYTKFKTIIDFFHRVCPLSFYQDDYIVSFVLHVAEVRVKSTWNNQKVAEHIHNVSLSNFQMHKDDEVFDREDQTKACITLNAPTVYRNYVLSDMFGGVAPYEREDL